MRDILNIPLGKGETTALIKKELMARQLGQRRELKDILYKNLSKLKVYLERTEGRRRF